MEKPYQLEDKPYPWRGLAWAVVLFVVICAFSGAYESSALFRAGVMWTGLGLGLLVTGWLLWKARKVVVTFLVGWLIGLLVGKALSR